MLVTSFFSFAALWGVQRFGMLNLMTIWLGIKVLTLGRVVFGALRLFGGASPLLAQRVRDESDYSD